MGKLTREGAIHLAMAMFSNARLRLDDMGFSDLIDKSEVSEEAIVEIVQYIFDQHEDETAGLVNTIDELYGRISAINEANVRLISKYEEDAKLLQERIEDLEGLLIAETKQKDDR